MTLNFKKISQTKRYGYARVSSREQAENLSLESQKSELIKLGIPEENIYLEIWPATDAIENRPIFFKLINPILKEGDLLALTKLDRCSWNTLSTISNICFQSVNIFPYIKVFKKNLGMYS